MMCHGVRGTIIHAKHDVETSESIPPYLLEIVANVLDLSSFVSIPYFFPFGKFTQGQCTLVYKPFVLLITKLTPCILL
jgi:hypothetical protein